MFGHFIRRARGPAQVSQAILDPADRIGEKPVFQAAGAEQGFNEVFIDDRRRRPAIAPFRLVPLVKVSRRELKDQFRRER